MCTRWPYLGTYACTTQGCLTVLQPISGTSSKVIALCKQLHCALGPGGLTQAMAAPTHLKQEMQTPQGQVISRLTQNVSNQVPNLVLMSKSKCHGKKKNEVSSPTSATSSQALDTINTSSTDSNEQLGGHVNSILSMVEGNQQASVHEHKRPTSNTSQVFCVNQPTQNAVTV